MKLLFDYPASNWQEALPIGNGHMGGMVYSGLPIDRIDLTENTFFSGEKNRPDKENSSDLFKAMRENISQKNYEEAHELGKEFVGKIGNYGTHLPTGYLEFNYEFGQDIKVESYKRDLDIGIGVVTTTYLIDGHYVKVEVFASHVDKVMVYKINSETLPFNALVSFVHHNNDLGRTESVIQDKNNNQAFLRFDSSARESVHSDGTCGVNLSGDVLIVSDGFLSISGKDIYAKEASEIICYVKMSTDYGKEDYAYNINDSSGVRDFFQNVHMEHIDSLMEISQISYEKLYQSHVDDIGKYMKRVNLNISSGISTKKSKELTNMFHYGRYLLLCSSREDSKLPAHLQGIWNDNVACQIGWTCDMHLDVNTQMNYWPAYTTNMLEVSSPLNKWITEDLSVSGATSASKFYGLDGWSAEVVSNAFAFSDPYWAVPLSPCPGCGIWTLTHLWSYYLYSQDKEYLNDKVYPAFKGSVEFFLGYLFEDKNKDDGYLHSGPSISPENSFVKDGKVYYMSNSPTFEVAMIRELFDIYIDICKILKTDNYLEEVKDAVSRLLPYKIMEDGTIAEWAHDYPAADSQHRHISHLLGLYPFYQIKHDDQELSKAAIRTLEKKMMPEETWEDTGWARSMLMLYEARLHRGNEAYYHIKMMLEKLKGENHFIMHPPTRGAPSFASVYELDGNTGLTTCIGEMLLQSKKGEIWLLPALPVEWESGYVRGLKAVGDVTVSVEWEEGRLKEAKLFVEQGKEEAEVLIHYNYESRKVVLVPGKEYLL